MTARPSDPYLVGITDMTNLYLDGRMAEAYEVSVDLELRCPERAGAVAHARACLLVQLGREEEAVAVAREVAGGGGWWSRRDLADSDLDPIREAPDLVAVAAAMNQREDAARLVAHGRTASCQVLRPDAPTAAVVVALPMYGVEGAETAGIWEPATQAGLAVCVCESSLRDGDGRPCWNDDALAERDVRMAAGVAADAVPGVPVVLAGGSQGARIAGDLALRGKVGPCYGFICVVGAPDVAAVGKSLTRARTAGIRGYFVVGGEDRWPGEQQRRAHQALQEAGITTELVTVAGLAHVYPPDWGPMARVAVDFCLAGEHPYPGGPNPGGAVRRRPGSA